MDELFLAVENSSDYFHDSSLPCVVYRHYQNIFDEIFLSIDAKQYGRTPKSTMRRKIVDFTDLYRAGKIQNGTEFVMEYDGVCHYAVAEYDANEGECYMLLLNDEKKPYFNQKGEKIGYYKASSQAAIDAVNMYRKNHQIEKRIDTLNGPAYWKTAAGITIKEMINSL